MPLSLQPAILLFDFYFVDRHTCVKTHMCRIFIVVSFRMSRINKEDGDIPSDSPE